MVHTPVPPSTDPPPPPIISPPNSTTHSALLTGCKVYAKRVEEDEPRKAEVLGIRPRVVRKSRLAKAAAAAAAAGTSAAASKEGTATPMEEDVKEEDKLEFYLHYVGFNKRLDEWVLGSRVLMSREVEWPQPTGASSTGGLPSGSQTPKTSGAASQKLPSGKATPTASSSPAPSRRAGKKAGTGQQPDVQLRKAALKAAATRTIVQRRKAHSETPPVDASAEGSVVDEDEEGDENEDPGDGAAVVQVEVVDDDPDADGEGDFDSDIGDALIPPGQEKKNQHFSKEQEIEKLRTSGSMTQSHSEVSRVKNLDKIQMGRHEVEAWYFSPYPIEYAHIPVLYVCDFCFSFYSTDTQLARHRRRCTMTHPPGNEIYRHEDIHFFEIDGRKQKTWCRNVCLLSKCFLDHKTLYYDVDPFLFYVMCRRDDEGLHMVGYFSKEKESAENYNLACILTLPQYQRLGYGKLLIEFSYELSKKEGKLGSPEKPLSDLGLLSYRAYWEETIVELILNNARHADDISIDEIAQKTAITHADVMHVCQALQMLKYSKNSHIIALSETITKRHEKAKAKKRRRIEPGKLVWKPPTFTRAQLQFGF